MILQHYIAGQWVPSSGTFKDLFHAINGEKIAIVGNDGADMQAALMFAKSKAGPVLRKMSFHDRGRALKALALHLLENKKKYYALSAATGATKLDSWIDIEGGCGNLFTYSSKGRRELPDAPYFLEGNKELLSKEGTFIGHHLMTPKQGVALHINAFNFPIWGMLEKIAVNLLAGVPAIVKPARNTSYLTELVFKDIINSKILPDGALQLCVGSIGDVLAYLDEQDVVTFTGSHATGMLLKGHKNLLQKSIPFNMEADSLNCCILGPDASVGTPEFDLFIKEVVKEMTVKCGQKCTAIRRAIIPENRVEDVQKALKNRLDKIMIGDPQKEGVRMGALAFGQHKNEVLQRVLELRLSCELIYGGGEVEKLNGGDREKGAFFAPTILYCKDPLTNEDPHSIEAFGPVTTLMPYRDASEAALIAKKGRGSLVGSIVSFDDQFIKDVVIESACFHGRMVFINRDCAKESTGHGSPMPGLVHGGPGRAGGGEEMGGLRGLSHYMQRTAIQGHPTTITKIGGVFQEGAKQIQKEKHPFQYYFEQLDIGQTLITHARTITETDIVNFANVSWDHFYAHTDCTSLAGTIFDERVAHGYFIMSAAAGLFVDPAKGPVMANYGLEQLRFLKPVYVGTTIKVHLTVKEKISQDAKIDPKTGELESPRGVVKWLVNVVRVGAQKETELDGESLAMGTILTLVQKMPYLLDNFRV